MFVICVNNEYIALAEEKRIGSLFVVFFVVVSLFTWIPFYLSLLKEF